MYIDLPLDQVDAMSNAIEWIKGLLLGSIMSTVAVIAVAIVGALLLSGRIPLRRGATTVIGCFILFSAAAIAEGLLVSIDHPQAEVAVRPPVPAYRATAPDAVADDPYAGAAVPARR